MVRNKPLVSKPETMLLFIMLMYDGWFRTGTKLQSLLDVWAYIYIYLYICIYALYWYMHVLGPGHGGVASCCLGLLIKWWQGRAAGQLPFPGPALACSTVNTEFNFTPIFWSVVNCSETGLGGEFSWVQVRGCECRSLTHPILVPAATAATRAV